MTLPQYLSSLQLGAVPNLRPLIWARDIITQRQLVQAGSDPYVVMRLMGLRTGLRMHQGQLFDQEIELTVYMEPTETDSLPSAAEVQKVYNALIAAVNHVDEGMYGRSIIELQYAGGFGPSFGERSSGLVAAIRFRERFGLAIN